MSSYSPSYYNQAIVILDSTASTDTSTGALIIEGGLGLSGFLYGNNANITNISYVNGTVSNLVATNLTSSNLSISDASISNLSVVSETVGSAVGTKIFYTQSTFGSLNVSGTSNLFTTNISGITSITNSTSSTASNNGALVVTGGLGVGQNLNVGGNAIINGDLTVNGITTTIYSTNVSITDNILTLNSGPSGTRDAGITMQRYQTNNDVGSGDVVSGSEVPVLSGTVQTGTTDTDIVLPLGASIVNNFYNGYWLKITSGSANDNVRKVVAYNGSTLTATLESALNSAPTEDVDTFSLYGKSFSTLYYNSISKGFVLGYTADDLNSFVDYADLYAQKGYFKGTLNVTGASSLTNTLINGNLNVTGLTTLGSISLTDINTTNVLAVNITTTNIISSTIQGTTSTISNAVMTNTTISNMVNTNSSISLATISNLLASNITASSIVSTDISSGQVNVSGLATFNTVTSNSETTGSLFASTGITSAQLNVTGLSVLNNVSSVLMTAGALVATGSITAAALVVSGPSTLANTVISNVTASNLNVSSNTVLSVATIANLITTNVTAANFVNTVSTIGTLNVNSVNLNPSLGDIFQELSFSAANNQGSAADVTGFSFANSTVRAFDAYVSVTILTTGDVANKYAIFELKGIQRLNNWQLNSVAVGDNTGITFSITSAGQLRYTSSNVGSFVSDTMKFRALTTTV